MTAQEVSTTPIEGQKPGTSGLRAPVSMFRRPNYLENFVQSVFDAMPELKGGLLILGGDGRYWSDEASGIVLRMAAANGVSRVIAGQGGIMSTPAASNLVRKHDAAAAFILSASHNPGGPDGDFGFKVNGANGGPAPEAVTDAIYQRTTTIDRYLIADEAAPDISQIGTHAVGDMTIEIIDPVADYTEMMAGLFDFAPIAELIATGFKLRFDAMNAVTGPYAKAILEDRLGAAEGSVIGAVPLPDFGGGHPDPTPAVVQGLGGADIDFKAASDGDGDRNMVAGETLVVSPSDSLAVLLANAHLVPAYQGRVTGVARSMPTSRAVDLVAKELGVDCYETPTGWKFFGSLLDAGRITLCGEESAGLGSDHVREKDGLWGVMFWLRIVAARGMGVDDILRDHWAKYGRHYYARLDYEGLPAEEADAVTGALTAALNTLEGRRGQGLTVSRAHVFGYEDPVDASRSENQGWIVECGEDARFVVRESGTGTRGKTLRIYLEAYEAPGGGANRPLMDALADVRALATDVLGLDEKLAGRTPNVVG